MFFLSPPDGGRTFRIRDSSHVTQDSRSHHPHHKKRKRPKQTNDSTSTTQKQKAGTVVMAFILGIVSALVAPFAVVFGFIIWDNHWTGSAFALNMYKGSLATIGFLIVSLYGRYHHPHQTYGHHQDENDTYGHLETDLSIEDEAEMTAIFTTEKVGFLMLSSTIGILIGDWAWLEGMRIIGARKVIYMDSLKPFLACLIGQIFLDEKLHPIAFIGLVMTVFGVALVGLEKEKRHEDEEEQTVQKVNSLQGGINDDLSTNGIATESDRLLNHRQYADDSIHSNIRDDSDNNNSNKSFATQRRSRDQSMKELIYGLIISFINVVFHTFGALLTRLYGTGMTTWEICLIRFGFAGISMLLVSTMLTTFIPIWKNLQSRKTKATTMADTTSPIVESMESDTESEEKENDDVSPWYRMPNDITKSSLIRVSIGVMFVSFFQPALTNYAIFQIPLAMLLTLESVGPLYTIPLSFVMQNEYPTMNAFVGAILAIGGIAILTFKGMV